MSKFAELIQAAIESLTTTAIDGSYSATETETRNYPRPAALSVETTNGNVTVSGEAREDVEVVVTKRGTDEEALQRARAVASGGDDEPLTLRAEFDGSASNVAADFEVRLPADVPVESIQTKNGSVELLDATGDARLETLNGSVTAERVDGYLDLRTKNGGITAREVTGVDHAESANGGIELELDDLRTDASVETKSGSVTIRAGHGLDADVTLTTSLGSIDAPLLGGSSSGLGTLEVAGTVGEGGHQLRVGTKLGSIEFRERESVRERESGTVPN